MSKQREKQFNTGKQSGIYFIMIILAFMVVVLSQCKSRQQSIKVKDIPMPKVRVDGQTIEKPVPPPPPISQIEANKCYKQEPEIVQGCGEPEGIAFDFGVEGGVEGGIVGGVVGGVLGAPISGDSYSSNGYSISPGISLASIRQAPPDSFNTEEYGRIIENSLLKALDNPLSTFSIDVDTGSYSNIRRCLNEYRFPPKDAVRIEEMINYFDYDYPEPEGPHPFSFTTDMAICPWDSSHLILHIGIRGKSISPLAIPRSNLVFLLDVSGSMDSPDKLPLLVSSFKLLIPQLTAQDRVAIVVYAGEAGLVLPSIPGDKKKEIRDALDKLSAGGSTAGGEGIRLAYQTAEGNFIPNGNNRIILATDGDFNVGVSSTSELIRLVETNREKGIYLTTLGFGSDNLKDNRLEQLADNGNGSYHYIDNIPEGKKVFVQNLKGTLFTIAKDVKLQVEFNPAKVDSYRLIGYENRVMKKEDFDNDKKDAGEVGSGHTVTALYEIIPVNAGTEPDKSNSLRYQEMCVKEDAFTSSEVAVVKLRYKHPGEEVSQLITQPVLWTEKSITDSTENLRFASSVALFAMLLRESEYIGKITYEDVLNLAKGAVGTDTYGYRAEFIHLVFVAKGLKQ